HGAVVRSATGGIGAAGTSVSDRVHQLEVVDPRSCCLVPCRRPIHVHESRSCLAGCKKACVDDGDMIERHVMHYFCGWRGSVGPVAGTQFVQEMPTLVALRILHSVEDEIVDAVIVASQRPSSGVTPTVRYLQTLCAMHHVVISQ